jgi:type I restriction enzyme, S subunit
MECTQLLRHFERLAETPDAPAKLRELVLELAERGTFGGADAKKVPLHSVAEFVMGQAPAGSECNETGEGTVFVKAGEFGPLYAEVRCWTTRPLKFARKGDVLICVVGATVGKLNLAIDSAIGRSVAAIRPSEIWTRDFFTTRLYRSRCACVALLEALLKE